MTTMTHYEDEAIIALLERGMAEAHADAHLSACLTCRSKIDEYGEITGTLHEEIVWRSAPAVPEPSAGTISFLRGVVQSARDEDAVAVPLVDELLAGTRDEWMPRLVADPKYRTAGVVRRLVVKADEASGKWPADQLAITELATDIAEHLNPDDYAPGTVARLRGDSWRERAYALDYTGDLHAAMGAIMRARQQYDRLPVADYEIARLELTRALILRHFDRVGEGLEAVRLAEPALRASGDVTRLHTARWIEAAMRMRAHDYRRALNIWLELEKEANADDEYRAWLLSNIGGAYRELGEYERALEFSQRAVQRMQDLRVASGEVVRIRWSVGELLQRMQRYPEAERLFKEVAQEFDARRMSEDSVLARLDLAELYIVQARYEEAIPLCSAVIRELSASGLAQTERALTAVTYLREATETHKATADLARHVRTYVKESRTQPALLFAPPPPA